MFTKIFLAVGTLLFAVFAALQINDATQYGNHDAWIWLVLYGAMALLSLWLLFRPLLSEIIVFFTGFVWGAFLFRIQDQKGNVHLEWLHPSSYWDPTGTTMVQNANESGGLLILAIWATCTLLLKRSGRLESAVD